jgi:hypothetical protein
MIKNKVTLPAGQYFIGDPCYAIPYGPDKDYWHEATATSDCFTKDINGFPFIGYSTYCGDGSYLGTDGYSYPVDAGVIGAVPMEFVRGDNLYGDHKYIQLGAIVEFLEPFECYSTDDGKIHIGHIMIDTNPCDEDTCADDSDDEDTCDDESPID